MAKFFTVALSIIAIIAFMAGAQVQAEEQNNPSLAGKVQIDQSKESLVKANKNLKSRVKELESKLSLQNAQIQAIQKQMEELKKARFATQIQKAHHQQVPLQGALNANPPVSYGRRVPTTGRYPQGRAYRQRKRNSRRMYSPSGFDDDAENEHENEHEKEVEWDD